MPAMMRVLAIVGACLFPAKVDGVRTHVKSSEQGRDRQMVDARTAVATFLLSSNLPLAGRTIGRNLLSSSLLSAHSPVGDRLSKRTNSGNTRSEESDKFVPTSLFCSRRAFSPVMFGGREDDGALSAEWSNLRADRGTQMGRADDVVVGVRTVWTLASNAGVYIMKDGTNTMRETYFVLAFERRDDAERYAHVASTSDSNLTPVEWQAEQFKSFCRSEDFEVAFARQFVIPPATMDECHYDVSRKLVMGKQERRSVTPPAHGLDEHHSLSPAAAFNAVNSVIEEPSQPTESKTWVVMINPGQANEAVFTLRQQRVLAFEKRLDALRFASKIQGAQPIQVNSWQLRDFCKNAGFDTSLVTARASISPPAVDGGVFSKSGATGLAPAREMSTFERGKLQNFRAFLEARLRQGMSEDDDWNIPQMR